MNTEKRRDVIIEIIPWIYKVIASVDLIQVGVKTQKIVHSILDHEQIAPKEISRRIKKWRRRQYGPDNNERTKWGKKIRPWRLGRIAWKELKKSVDNEFSIL